jgi:hypothetical protein
MERTDRHSGATDDQRLHTATHFSGGPIGECNCEDATRIGVALEYSMCNSASDYPRLPATRPRSHHKGRTIVHDGTSLFGVQIVEKYCHDSIGGELLLPRRRDKFSCNRPYPTM